MFKQNDIDTIESIHGCIGTCTDMFLELRGQGDAEENVDSFRHKIEEDLAFIDGKMSTLLVEDTLHLTLWAARMGLCRKTMDTLDKNLAFKGKRQWSWEEVARAMAYLLLVRDGAKATLALNGVDTFEP